MPHLETSQKRNERLRRKSRFVGRRFGIQASVNENGDTTYLIANAVVYLMAQAAD
jgi:hypothetical protein